MKKQSKTWLFWVLISAALLGPIVAGGLNHIIDSHFSHDQLISIASNPTQATQTVCLPVLDQAAFDRLDTLIPGQENDLTLSLRMALLFFADQAARRLPARDPQKLNTDDTARRVEVLEYILHGQIHSGRNLVYAAYIFQHGDCSAHYQFANRLAQIAMDAGYPQAGWIYAATLDRYLVSIGKPQKFGTQTTRVNDELQRYPVDPTTSDAEREKYHVPPLSEIDKTKPAGNNAGTGASGKRWLESWWLTLIGSAFAILGAAICVVEAKPNPLAGKIIFVFTLLIFSLSVAGHYAQVNALAQGTFEAQQKIWSGVNRLILAAWLMLACIGALRWFRAKSA